MTQALTTFSRLMSISLLLLASITQAAIEKSPNDSRDYLSFTLPNQMKVLVISDPATDKAAASLDLNVGTNANPKNRQGLAHFLEHMLFLGTEKYPEAGSYQAFISQNGGNHNAYTAFENTNYFFDIRADQLEPALDRFARFFIDPLFTEEYVDRERHAVHSEYQSNLRDDGRRSFSATKQVMNPEHQYSQFAVGSLETLSNDNGDLRRDLIQFYNRYYSANLMTLVVLGKQPTAELKAMVEARFSTVKNNAATISNSPVPVYKDLPLQLNIRTVKDVKQLKLTFPIPAMRQHFRDKPAFYIAAMLGYEGKGSLFAVLKQQGLANGVGVYSGIDLPDQSSLTISVSLTEKGFQQYDQVITTTFEAIHLLQQKGISEELFREEQLINERQFRFKEASQPTHYVGQLARKLQFYPTNLVIKADYLMENFRPGLINDTLSQMTPDNVLITLLGQTVDTDKTDPWFNAEYSVSPVPEERRNQWLTATATPELAVRQPNPFVATDLALKPGTEKDTVPEILFENNGRTLWYQQDTEFGVPKADFWFTVITDSVRESARSVAMTALFTDLLKDSLNETLYDASQAGLNARIYAHAQGFTIRISGYNDKQKVLLEAVLQQLQNPHFAENDFTRIRELYIQELENSLKDKPYNQTIGEIYTLLMQNWSTEDKLAALADLDLQQLHAFIPRLLEKTEVRMLANGNLTAEEAMTLAQQVISTIPANPEFSGRKPLPVVLLNPSQPLTQTLPVEHNDSAISVYLQGADSDIKTRASFALLGEMMSAPFYSKLRTEQQLGYIVFETPLPLRKAPGLAFVVQSPNTDPVTLEQHIDQFLADMTPRLEAMTDEELEGFKASVLSRINRKATRLAERTNRYWQEIDRDEKAFDSRQQLSQAVENITLESLQKAFSELPLRRLTVRSFGEQHRQAVSGEELAQVSDPEISRLKEEQQFVPGA